MALADAVQAAGALSTISIVTAVAVLVPLVVGWVRKFYR